jgi:hypothetical protein
MGKISCHVLHHMIGIVALEIAVRGGVKQNDQSHHLGKG